MRGSFLSKNALYENINLSMFLGENSDEILNQRVQYFI